MPDHLTGEELVALIRRVFQPGAADRTLAFLVDLPDDTTPDTPDWAARRALVTDWLRLLRPLANHLGLATTLVAYRNVGANNAPFPPTAWVLAGDTLPDHVEALATDPSRPFEQLFDEISLWLAPTRFSATAPLKLAARTHALRGATMPGFTAAMVPALRLDYGTIQRRVGRLKAWLDEAEGAVLEFKVDDRTCELVLDLRHRHGHASSGCFPEPGSVGNLPSGEAYIVPYEGEFDHSSSLSRGELPVQFGDEVVIYTIAENRAVAVRGEGEAARREALAITAEPAYANLAELGLGVLADLGVKPIGELLLDEKLGLHVAFGRSDHFGGMVGPAQFSSPEKAVHLDRVYLPETQPRVHVTRVDLVLEDGRGIIPLMRDGRYAVSLD